MRTDAVSELYAVADCVLEPVLGRLAAGLASVAGLSEAERQVIRAAAASALRDAVGAKVSRVLLVELHAAKLTGRLTAPDARGRWTEWVALAARPQFWDSLAEHYPTLSQRLECLIDNRCAAVLSLAQRFAADRASLGELVGGELGELVGLELGAGDSHRGGHTVAVVRCAGGRVVYKPRSAAVDAALSRLLSRVLAGEPAGVRLRVPRVVCRDGYGWAEFVEHRYCADEEELRRYYRNLGHLLAVMRLIGGTDLHAGNLIAVGPVPTVVDCETVFTPEPPPRVSGFGLAVDRAASLVHESVLRTGLLPSRGQALGWRGIDMSAAGSVPDQQPAVRVPVIVDAGTDEARVGYERLSVPAEVNRPSPDLVLGSYWDVVVAGFTELTGRLRRLDADGELEGLLTEFADVAIRVVLRSTESYAELASMLWHPESLHDEAAARRRAEDLLARQADNLSGAPSDPRVIEAEVDELLVGDIPFFTTTPRRGWLTGPGGVRWGAAQELVGEAVRRWRAADLTVERQVIQSALVGAYLDESWLPQVRLLPPPDVRADDLDRRRRAVAAGIMRTLVDSAVRGDDGTATWIAPVLNPTGWMVQPIGLDIYGGASGIAILLAAYQRETNAGRADPVASVAPLLAAVLRTMDLVEQQWAKDRAAAGDKVRPAPVGGYIGLGSRIWAWLLLRRLDAVDSDTALARVDRILHEVPAAVAADAAWDLMAGIAGAAVPLLRYADLAGNTDAADLARDIGTRLVAAAKVDDDTACWPTDSFPDGIGGLSHGATGIGWALSRLADATGDTAAAGTAEAAFAYEETLYDPARRAWRDKRDPDAIPLVWCHGAGGIGIVAADQLRHGGDGRWRDVLSRAAVASWPAGIGWTHTLCHGALGTWEVLDAAITAGVGPPGLDRPTLDAHILGSLEQHGPVSGLAREVVAPGLFPGLGGVAYQLLRMHPDCTLPSVLLPDPDLSTGP